MFDDTKLTKVGTNSEENFGITMSFRGCKIQLFLVYIELNSPSIYRKDHTFLKLGIEVP